MSEYISKSGLLKNHKALPEEDFNLETGGKVRIRGLDGYKAMEAGEASLADRVFICIRDGLINPKLTKYEDIMDFVKFRTDDAQEISARIGTITRQFREEVFAETSSAKKNS